MTLSDELIALAKKLSSYAGHAADVALLGQAAAALKGHTEDASAPLTVIPDAAVVDAAVTQEANDDGA